MTTADRLFHNTLSLLVSNVGSAGLSFLLSLLIGRTLGEDGLGVYTTALAWVFPLTLVAEFGLGTLITRDLAQQPAAEADYLRAASIARLWLGGGLTLLLLVIAPLLSDNLAVVRGLQIAAPLIFILPTFSLLTAVFRARQEMWPIPWLNIGMLVMQVLLTALVFMVSGGVIPALIVNTITSAGQLAVAWWVYRHWFFRRRNDMSIHGLPLVRDLGTLPPVKEDNSLAVLTPCSLTARIRHGPESRHNPLLLLRRAWPFALAAILAAVQMRLSMILLERLADTANVGYYAAATRFVEAGRVIPNALFGALFPTLTALAQQPAIMTRTFRRINLQLAGFGFALTILFSATALPVIQFTYGERFAPAAPVLQIAMWALLPGLLRGARTLYWYAQGQERFANKVTAGTLAFQAVVSLWLIPAHGAVGAALVSLLTETAALILLWRPDRS